MDGQEVTCSCLRTWCSVMFWERALPFFGRCRHIVVVVVVVIKQQQIRSSPSGPNPVKRLSKDVTQIPAEDNKNNYHIRRQSWQVPRLNLGNTGGHASAASPLNDQARSHPGHSHDDARAVADARKIAPEKPSA